MAELSIKKEQSNYFMRNLKRRAASGSQDYERAAKQSKNTKSSQSGYSRRKESREASLDSDYRDFDTRLTRIYSTRCCKNQYKKLKSLLEL